jgi:AcrR family transcriptional regulator
LDTAARIAASRGVEAVTMETVSDEAGVSRALVYKHFANRGELLTSVYRREARLLHAEMAAEVRSATSLEGMYRALIRASFRVSAERGALFAALRAAGAWNRDLRAEQRARDRDTVKAFASQAAREYGMPMRDAQQATSMLLGAVDSIMMQWRARRTTDNAAALEEIYISLVNGGLERLAGASR